MEHILPTGLQHIVWDYATSLSVFVMGHCRFDWNSIHEYFCYFLQQSTLSSDVTTVELVCATRCLEQLLFVHPYIFRHDTTFGIMAHVIELSLSFKGRVVLYILSLQHRDLIWDMYEMVSGSDMVLFRGTRIPVQTFIFAVRSLHHAMTCYDIVRWLYHLNPNFRCI